MDQSAYRQDVLRSIEQALIKARQDAQEIDQPVLAYFLDMAIAEINSHAVAGPDAAYEPEQTKMSGKLKIVN